jgi:hypothetical protein
MRFKKDCSMFFIYKYTWLLPVCVKQHNTITIQSVFDCCIPLHFETVVAIIVYSDSEIFHSVLELEILIYLVTTRFRLWSFETSTANIMKVALNQLARFIENNMWIEMGVNWVSIFIWYVINLIVHFFNVGTKSQYSFTYYCI